MRSNWIETPAPPDALCTLHSCGCAKAVAVFVPAMRPGYMPVCDEHLKQILGRNPNIEVREVRW